jgi:hypothetical protein
MKPVTLVRPRLLLQPRPAGGLDAGPLTFVFAQRAWAVFGAAIALALGTGAAGAALAGEPVLMVIWLIFALLGGWSAVFCLFARYSLTLDEFRRVVVYRTTTLGGGVREVRIPFADFREVELVNVLGGRGNMLKTRTWVVRLKPRGDEPFHLGAPGLRALAAKAPIEELARDVARRMALPLVETAR